MSLQVVHDMRYSLMLYTRDKKSSGLRSTNLFAAKYTQTWLSTNCQFENLYLDLPISTYTLNDKPHYFRDGMGGWFGWFFRVTNLWYKVLSNLGKTFWDNSTPSLSQIPQEPIILAMSISVNNLSPMTTISLASVMPCFLK